PRYSHRRNHRRSRKDPSNGGRSPSLWHRRNGPDGDSGDEPRAPRSGGSYGSPPRKTAQFAPALYYGNQTTPPHRPARQNLHSLSSAKIHIETKSNIMSPPIPTDYVRFFDT